MTGQTCFVVGFDTFVSRRLAEALAQQRLKIATIGKGGSPESAVHPAMACGFETRSDVDTAFDTAISVLGKPGLVVISLIPAALLQSNPIDEAASIAWVAPLHTAMISTIFALQAAQRSMQGSGGTIVIIGAAMSLVGAAGLAPLSTLLEAQRALVKSAARQWGGEGIRLHWVGLGPVGNFPELESMTLPAVPELGPPPPALMRVPTAESGVAALIALLAADGAAALTGSTLMIDGGEWMVP